MISKLIHPSFWRGRGRLLFLFLCFGVGVRAATVSITNASFDVAADFQTTNLKTQDTPNSLPVTGWTSNGGAVWSVSGVIGYGTSGQLNGVSVPDTDKDGNATGGTLGISVGWDGVVTYWQEVTLPAGEYTLTVDAYNGNSATRGKSQLGFVADGASFLSSRNSFPSNTWIVDEVSFTLDAETTGRIQVGLGAVSGGSNSNAKVFFDNVTLTRASGPEDPPQDPEDPPQDPEDPPQEPEYDNKVMVSSAEGGPGEEVTVSLSVENTADVASMQVTIPLTDGLTLVEGSEQLGSRCASHSLTVGVKDDVLNVLVYSLAMTPFTDNSGEVVTFRLKLGTQPASTVLQPTRTVLADSNGTQIDASAVGGTVITRCAKAEYSTMTVDFGHVPIRSTYTQMVTVRNTGNADLTLTSMDFTDVNVFSTTTPLPLIVAPGASQALNVTYAPVNRGSIERSLKVVCNSVSKLNTIKLKADPYAVNELHMLPASGNSDEEVTVQMTMNNMDAVSGMQVEFDMPDALEYVDGSFAIAPDRKQDHVSVVSLTGSKLRIIVYSPSDTPFTGNDGVIGSMRVRLKGPYDVQLTPSKTVLTATINNMVENVVSAVYGTTVSINSPDIVTDNVLDFGAVSLTEACEKQLTIRNYGSAPLTVSRIAFDNEHFSIKESLPIVISTWNAATVTVVYNNLEEASFESLMQIYSNDPNLRLKEVTVKGSRFAPNYLSVATPDVFADKPLSVDVSIDNYDAVTGIQFDLTYPAAQYEPFDGNYTLTERATGMTLTWLPVGTGKLRCFGYFMSDAGIAPGEGLVLSLLLRPVGETVGEGSYQVSLSDIKLGTPGLANKYTGSNCSSSFRVTFIPGEGDTYQTFALAEGWNWVSGYLSSVLSLEGKTEGLNRVLSQTEELINDPQLGFVGGVNSLEPGVGYKVETTKPVSWAFKGYVCDPDLPVDVVAGWNWVGYPHDEAMPLGVMGNAEEGDCIVGQTAFAEYAEGEWKGTLSQLIPGAGYLYKSVTTKQLAYNFDHTTLNLSSTLSGNDEFASRQDYPSLVGTPLGTPLSCRGGAGVGSVLLPHRYPHTMNITARVVMDGSVDDASDYYVEAISGSELRGISQLVGDRIYLTVYGEETVPVSLVVTQLSTGATFTAHESLLFSSDMVGSYRQPFNIHIGNTTEITETKQKPSETGTAVYDLQGRKLSTVHSPSSIIKKGIYIINGRKTVVR